MQRCGYFIGAGHRTDHPHRALAPLANRDVDTEDLRRPRRPGHHRLGTAVPRRGRRLCDRDLVADRVRRPDRQGPGVHGQSHERDRHPRVQQRRPAGPGPRQPRGAGQSLHPRTAVQTLRPHNASRVGRTTTETSSRAAARSLAALSTPIASRPVRAFGAAELASCSSHASSASNKRGPSEGRFRSAQPTTRQLSAA